LLSSVLVDAYRGYGDEKERADSSLTLCFICDGEGKDEDEVIE
jgi:hypothetical protein